MFHHPIKAGIDVVSFTAAVGVITNNLPWILGVPSFVWAMINIAEWSWEKYKKFKQ